MSSKKEWLLLIVVGVIMGFIGAAAVSFMNDLIDITRAAACFDYKDPEICEEVNQ